MKQNHGQAALIAVILMMVLMLSLIFAASGVALKDARVAEENKKARFAYFSAEAGVDDAAYRLKRGKNLVSSFSVTLNGATAAINITTVGATKEIKSTGDFSGAARAVDALLSNSTGVSFHYGVQVGDDGLEMGDNSKVEGNVFSNGNISGAGFAKSRVTGNAQVAGAHSISNIRVNNGASAHSFNNCIIDGQAQYVSSFTSCTASSTQVISQDIAPQDFPITQAQITQWENDAAAGGTINGYTLGNGDAGSLGPKKINGNINFGNGSTLTLTGTLWVTGTINFGNNDIIKLDPAAYGNLSGLIVVDGIVDVGNGADMKGSGQAGSYFMLLSTASGEAIDIGNNATSTIFYAPNGKIKTGNGLNLREAVGKGLEIGNNSSITYESGLANINFASGPSGGWDIINWKEIIP